MKIIKILAIETSCDETAASIVEKNGSNIIIISNVVASQINIHKKFGGVFPEHASRAHTEKIIPVVEEALGKTKPDVIAVTTGPGLIGSLLVGVNFAKTYAYTKNLPIIGINHWLGHIYSCFPHEYVIHSDSVVIDGDSLPANKHNQLLNHAAKPQITFPLLALIVSGGHTGLVLMKSHTDIEPLGETLDDAAGEAFDKVAKLLGLDYPGGPAISAAANCHSERREESPANAGSRTSREILHYVRDDKIKFPRSMLDRKDYNFSFSGLKTAVLYKFREIESQFNHNQSRGEAANHYKSLIAYEFQQAVIDILVGKTLQAAKEFNPKSICLCGGVSANKELRIQMEKAVMSLRASAKQSDQETTFHVPPFILTTDNAAMIGIAAAYHLDEANTWKNINADANLRL